MKTSLRAPSWLALLTLTLTFPLTPATAQTVVTNTTVASGQVYQAQDPVQVINYETSTVTVEVQSGGTATFRSSGNVTLKPGFKATSGSFFQAAIIQSYSTPLAWVSVSGATLYNVYRNGIYIGNSASPTYTDTAVPLGATYTYTIKAVVGGVETTVVIYTIATAASFEVFTPLR